MKIAVAGGTGLLGRPVVQELLSRGHKVRVLGRSKERIVRAFGQGVEAVEIDLVGAGASAVRAALEGCEGLHISLAGSGSRKAYVRSQSLPVQKLMEAGRASGLAYVSYLSAATVNHPNAADFYDNQGKRLAEQFIQSSGIRHRIFRPSWFLETLPLFVQSGAVSMIGNPRYPQAWLAAADYAVLVADALEDRPASASVWVGGPEELTIAEAVARYAEDRGLPIRSFGVGAARFFAALGGGHTLRLAADLADYFDRTPDHPEGSDERIATKTGFTEWLGASKSASAT